MKAFVCALVCALAAVSAWAAPSPDRVPADADLVVVLDGLERAAPAKGDAKAEAKTPADVWRQLGEFNPWLLHALDELGMPEALQQCPLTSIVASVKLPEQGKEAEASRGAPSAFPSVYAFIESAKVDWLNLDVFAGNLCAMSRSVLQRAGEWRRIAIEGGGNRMPFWGYRPAEGGIAIAFCPEATRAETWATGKGTPLSKDSPLRAAFHEKPSPSGLRLTVAVPDFAALLRRLCAPARLERMKEKGDAYLLDIHALCLTMCREGRKIEGRLELTAADEATAKRLQAHLMKREVMSDWQQLIQHFASVVYPSNGRRALAVGTGCERKGAKVIVSISVSPNADPRSEGVHAPAKQPRRR